MFVKTTTKNFIDWGWFVIYIGYSNNFAGYLESWTATPMNSEWQSYDMLSIVCETGSLIVKTGSV